MAGHLRVDRPAGALRRARAPQPLGGAALGEHAAGRSSGSATARPCAATAEPSAGSARRPASSCREKQPPPRAHEHRPLDEGGRQRALAQDRGSGVTVASTTVGGGPSRRPPSTTSATSSASKAWATSAGLGEAERHGAPRTLLAAEPAQGPPVGHADHGRPGTPSSASPPAPASAVVGPIGRRVGPRAGTPRPARASSARAACRARRSSPRSARARRRSARPRSAGPSGSAASSTSRASSSRDAGPHGQAVAAHVGHGDDRPGRQRVRHRRRSRPDQRRAGLVGTAASSMRPIVQPRQPRHQRAGPPGQVRLDPHLVVPELPGPAPRAGLGLVRRQLDDHGPGPAEPAPGLLEHGLHVGQARRCRRRPGPATRARRGSARTSGVQPGPLVLASRRAGSTPPGRPRPRSSRGQRVEPAPLRPASTGGQATGAATRAARLEVGRRHLERVGTGVGGPHLAAPRRRRARSPAPARWRRCPSRRRRRPGPPPARRARRAGAGPRPAPPRPPARSRAAGSGPGGRRAGRARGRASGRRRTAAAPPPPGGPPWPAPPPPAPARHRSGTRSARDRPSRAPRRR